MEVTVPAPGIQGHGSLFLDDGESASDARFLLDARVENDGRRLKIHLLLKASAFVPAQRDLEIRAPRNYSSMTVDGKRCVMTGRDLSREDRSVILSIARVPLDAREIVIE